MNGLIRGGSRWSDWGDRPPEIYESNLIHHDFNNSFLISMQMNFIILISMQMNFTLHNEHFTKELKDNILETWRKISHYRQICF